MNPLLVASVCAFLNGTPPAFTPSFEVAEAFAQLGTTAPVWEQTVPLPRPRPPEAPKADTFADRFCDVINVTVDNTIPLRSTQVLGHLPVGGGGGWWRDTIDIIELLGVPGDGPATGSPPGLPVQARDLGIASDVVASPPVDAQ